MPQKSNTTKQSNFLANPVGLDMLIPYLIVSIGYQSVTTHPATDYATFSNGYPTRSGGIIDCSALAVKSPHSILNRIKLMKMSCFVFGLLALGGSGAILSADDASVQKKPVIQTTSAFDGLLYKSAVAVEAVRSASGLNSPTGKNLKGIGLISASERGVAAMTKLLPNWKNEWELHCAKRKRIGGESWLYEITFVKQASRIPDSPSEQLNIWVLFDGTVVPTETSKNS